jgi:hypothetical protein
MLNARLDYSDRMMRTKPSRKPIKIVKPSVKFRSVNHDKPVLKLK